jgi:hypothetical protein
MALTQNPQSQMPQAYSDPNRMLDKHALPDIEYWQVGAHGSGNIGAGVDLTGQAAEPGWYWWVCFPGCLPDSDPSGPFTTEKECVDDFTQDWMDD